MKSEHRHHLAENDLEHKLGELGEKLKPYSKQILFGSLALSALAVIAVFVFNNLRAEDRSAWSAFTACQNASQFEEVAVNFPGSSVAQWAWINAGEMRLQNGAQLSFTSRTVAVEDLEAARVAFEKVLNDSNSAPEAIERALNGMGRTLETLCETQAAIEAYQKLISDFPASQYRRWAEYRVEELQRPEVQEFYAWYKDQTPDPSDRPLPEDGPFGSTFDIPPLLDRNAPPYSGNVPEIEDATGDAETEAEGTATEPEGTESGSGDATDESADSTEASDGPELGPAEPDETSSDQEADTPDSQETDASSAEPSEGDAGSSLSDDDGSPSPGEDATSEGAESSGNEGTP
jgi:hypothetical protein